MSRIFKKNQVKKGKQIETQKVYNIQNENSWRWRVFDIFFQTFSFLPVSIASSLDVMMRQSLLKSSRFLPFNSDTKKIKINTPPRCKLVLLTLHQSAGYISLDKSVYNILSASVQSRTSITHVFLISSDVIYCSYYSW